MRQCDSNCLDFRLCNLCKFWFSSLFLRNLVFVPGTKIQICQFYSDEKHLLPLFLMACWEDLMRILFLNGFSGIRKCGFLYWWWVWRNFGDTVILLKLEIITLWLLVIRTDSPPIRTFYRLWFIVDSLIECKSVDMSCPRNSLICMFIFLVFTLWSLKEIIQ
jgi:hypothetical protein